MSGPTPILATHRVVFRYTVDGFAHKTQMYTSAVASADPTGWDLQGRIGGPGNVGFSLIPDAFFNIVKLYFQASKTTFSGADLEHNVSGSFVFVASQATTVTPTGSAAYGVAMGLCVSGKDEANRLIPTYIYEAALGNPTKIASYSALGPNDQAVVNYLFHQAGAVLNTDSWNWRVARGGILLPKRFLAWVIDSNEKLRRLRGIK